MSQPPAAAPPSLPPVRVLVVDDDLGVQETLQAILEAKGHRTDAAGEGSAALAHLGSNKYDLALLDIGLPGMSGTDVLAQAATLQPDMKCIMVTGNTDLQAAVDALNQGAYAYIRKPFEVPDVEAIVTRALNEQILERANRVFSTLARSLVEHIDLEKRLELIVSSLSRVTGVARGAVWLMERDTLQLVYVSGLAEEQRGRLRRLQVALDEVSPALRSIVEGGAAAVVTEPQSLSLLPEDSLQRWGIRTALLLPLRSGGRLIGLAALSEPNEERHFAPGVVAYAETIANMAAVAIQQARTIQEERSTLSALAQSFQTNPPHHRILDLASRYEPAAEVAKIGGDYFDFIEFDNRRLGVVVGDVCGKGLPAAVYTGKAKDMLRAYALEDDEGQDGCHGRSSPASVLGRLNRALCRQMSDMFVTMVYGVIDVDTGVFTYTNAGHPHPVVYLPQSNEIIELPPGQGDDGPANGLVGAVVEMTFTEQTLELQPGSVIAFFTDGVSEARTGPEMFEVSGVREVVRAHAGESAETIANAIYNRALEFAGGVLRDDVAIVVIKNG